MTPLRLSTALIAAAALAACTTPRSQPAPSKAVADARAHRDVAPDAGCPTLVSPASVGFAFNESTIADIATPALESVTRMLACHPQATALIVGDADNHGTDAEQHKLAQARVQAVSGYLTAHGVAAARLGQQVGGKAPAGGGNQLIVMAEGRRW
jgi:outer membrane protein OmpA-like peptidoglycan-associated protein